MTPRWLQIVAAAAAMIMALAMLIAVRTYARGQWVVVEYESRGPHRYSKVLLNDRTGQTCELNRRGASPTDSSLGADAFWMCNQPPRRAETFMPK